MMMAVQRESNELVFRLCMRVEAIIPQTRCPQRFHACVGNSELARE